ncbi:hypothetical protein Tco_1485218 [Tanacetum coccineum]
MSGPREEGLRNGPSILRQDHVVLVRWFSLSNVLLLAEGMLLTMLLGIIIAYISLALDPLQVHPCSLKIIGQRIPQRYGYIKNHKKTIKIKQARTRERKSEQKPEAKPGKVNPSVKVVKSWSTKVNKTQNIPFKPLNFQENP